MDRDLADDLQARVREAHAARSPLCIVAGGTRGFYGRRVEGAELAVGGHRGIIEYQPSELVVTVRAGTPLAELEEALREQHQMLAFEPPHHGEDSTIGGAIACGLSGPRRAAAGAARDFVLGTTVINGLGQRCRFGGQVMKNVAGYDAARLMVGAQGTLGLLLDVSLKVLPMPKAEETLKLSLGAAEMPARVLRWVRQGLPITASCHREGTLCLRLGSTPSAVRAARARIAREHICEQICEELAADFWRQIRDQRHPFFRASGNLWRLSHLPTAPFYSGDPEAALLEWNGALRWVHAEEDMYAEAERHGGHAQRHPLHAREGADGDIFPTLAPGLARIQRRLREAFDPHGILNPGRLCARDAAAQA